MIGSKGPGTLQLFLTPFKHFSLCSKSRTTYLQPLYYAVRFKIFEVQLLLRRQADRQARSKETEEHAQVFNEVRPTESENTCTAWLSTIRQVAVFRHVSVSVQAAAAVASLPQQRSCHRVQLSEREMTRGLTGSRFGGSTDHH